MSPSDLPVAAKSSATSRPPAALNLRFSVRTLLVLIAVASVLFAVTSWIGSIWSVSLVLLALIVGAHVLGNALGTRLRDHATESIRRGGPDYEAMRHNTAARLGNQATDHAMLKYQPHGHLVERHSLGWLPMAITVFGAIGGSSLFAIANWKFSYFDDFRWGDRLIAIGSFAVLGGLAAYAIGTFVQVGLWPAVRYYFLRGARQRLEESGSFDRVELASRMRVDSCTPSDQRRKQRPSNDRDSSSQTT